MGAKTKIEWTDASWNPVRGCSRISAGCENCYAERVAHRFSGSGQPYEGLTTKGRWSGRLRVVGEHLEDPLRWTKPRRVFVNSMSDLFHERLGFEDIWKIFDVMRRSPRHTFQVLTKRPHVMLDFLTEKSSEDFLCLPNVWLGVSVEDQKTADERIPLLLETPAAVRFLSCEPLLGPVVLGKHGEHYIGDGRSPDLDWLIVGGESGPGARPMHPVWVWDLRDQCIQAGVPFFFKQWGEWGMAGHDAHPFKDHLPGDLVPMTTVCSTNRKDIGEVTYRAILPDLTSFRMRKVGKKAAGSLIDGREWKEFPRPPL
jgi:protein gp37